MKQTVTFGCGHERHFEYDARNRGARWTAASRERDAAEHDCYTCNHESAEANMAALDQTELLAFFMGKYGRNRDVIYRFSTKRMI